MSTAIFFNTPAHGHINPTLPVVTELVKRGERVIYYALEEFRPAIERTGASFCSYEHLFWFMREDTEEITARHLEALIQDCHVLIPRLLAAIQEIKPDYIIHDSLCPWGKYIAQMTGLPAICSSVIFGLTRKLLMSMPGDIVGKLGMYIVMKKVEAQIRTAVAHLSEKYRIPMPDALDLFTNVEQLNIVYTSRQFQPFAHLLDDSFKLVGASILPRPGAPAFPFEQLREDRPLIYISLGTFFNAHLDFYRMCCDAFANPKWQVVMSIGQSITAEQLGTIPDNILVRPVVPQLALLPRVNLFITHAGMGSANEALYYRVPMIAIPQAGDQPWVARRIEQVGAGKELARGRVSVSRLRRMAEKIMANPVYAQASGRMGETLRQAGGYQRAVDEIMEFKRAQDIE